MRLAIGLLRDENTMKAGTLSAIPLKMSSRDCPVLRVSSDRHQSKYSLQACFFFFCQEGLADPRLRASKEARSILYTSL